jgi:histidinol-phosphate aminotransferase
VVVTTPSFEMYRRSTLLAGGEVREAPWWAGEFPVGEVCSLASRQTAAVTVVSPNNPTGSTISAAGLDELLERLPGALVLLDHAYVEFADEDLTQVALSRPNGLVLRTFSKAWGCAGLRVGYAMGDPRVLTWLRSTGQPYPVSTLSLLAVSHLLEADPSQRNRYVRAVRQERERLSQALERLGAAPLPSQANFVLARFADADAVHSALARRGVKVRAYSRPSSLEGHLRISLPGDDESFGLLLQRLDEAVAETRGGGA